MTAIQYHSRSTVALCALILAFAAGGCAVSAPGGENSKPIAVPANQTMPLTLSGDQEVPALTTAALGTGSFEIPPERTITGGLATTGIIATAAHIHEGPVGKNGPVVLPLSRTGDNTWSVPPNATLTEAQYLSYLAGDLYVNVHSANHPDGEIRAQLRPK